MTATRAQFFAKLGAEMTNQRWSWCAANHEQKTVYFGIFDGRSTSAGGLILSEDWEVRRNRRQPGYSDALRKIELIENDGYALGVFTMVPRKIGDDETGPSEIDRILDDVRAAHLSKVGRDWYAIFEASTDSVAEELNDTVLQTFPEGAKTRVTVNAYERSAAARQLCIAHYGHKCRACGFDFETVYGTLGAGFVHVHHVNPLALVAEDYTVDPIRDLVPLCPNCHAMVHRTNPPISVNDLKSLIATRAEQ